MGNDRSGRIDERDLAATGKTNNKSGSRYVQSFGEAGFSDASHLEVIILDTDLDITTARTAFEKERILARCTYLKKVCVKQKNLLEEYSKLAKTSIAIKNKDLDDLIKRCDSFESNIRRIEEGYVNELRSTGEKIACILTKEFKTRTLSDYKNLLELSIAAKECTLRAEKEKVNIPHSRELSVFELDKNIELANKQIQYFEKLKFQNEEKLRELNQNIVNALIPMSERSYEDSKNIIRLCENMKKQLEFLKSKGAEIPKLRFTDINNLDECIAIEQKRIDEEKERKRRIEAEQNRRMQECAAKVSSYDRELAKYADSSNCYNLSLEECNSIISTARELKREIDYLKENEYKVPYITWPYPDVLIQKIERRIEKIKEIRSEAISDIKNRDQAISGMIRRDYKVLSIDECRQIIKICKEQKRKIEYYKNKGVHVSGLNNGNMDYLIDKFEDICNNKIKQEKERKQGEKRELYTANEIQKIKEGLEKYTARRINLQEKMEENWALVRKNISRKEVLDPIFDEIGKTNHEINKLISQLLKHPKQYSCYQLAINYLIREIERSRELIVRWNKWLEKVENGRAQWQRTDATIEHDNSKAQNYINSLHDRIERYKEKLEKLEDMNSR